MKNKKEIFELFSRVYYSTWFTYFAAILDLIYNTIFFNKMNFAKTLVVCVYKYVCVCVVGFGDEE